MTALIIDDEKDICHLVAAMLHRKGVDCLIANDLKEGRKALKKKICDLTFLDLNLPDGDGFDIVPDVRTCSPKGRLYIMSAHDGEKERRLASEMGVDGFIKKPFTKTDILNTLES